MAWPLPLALVASGELVDPKACFRTFVDNRFGSHGVRVKLNFYELEQTSFEELRELSDLAGLSLQHCWSAGGRFWSADFPTNTSGEALQQRTAGRPMSVSFCTPAMCKKREIPELLEVYLYEAYGIPAAIPRSSVLLVELGAWDDFNIHFAIVGVDGCGTTSFRGNLGLHEQVEFSASQIEELYEDTFFTWRLAYYLLPPKFLQRRWLNFNEQRRQSTTLLGLYNALVWRHPMARLALHQMSTRPLMIVCSPARWLASTIVNFHNRTPGSVAVPDLIDAASWSALAVRHLDEWRRLFGDRLLVIHQEALLQRDTYDAVTSFLGLSPLPIDAKLGRFKVRGTSWRSGLCRSRDHALLEQLNGLLQPQALAIEQLLQGSGQAVPPSLWQVQGHCSSKPARTCSFMSREIPCE